MAVAAIWLYMVIKDQRFRICCGIVFTPILLRAGPVAILFAVLVSCFELLNRTPKGYWILLLAKFGIRNPFTLLILLLANIALPFYQMCIFIKD